MRKENKFMYLEVILDSTQQCFCFEELCGIYWLVTKMATQKESTTTSIWWRHFLSYKVTQNNKNISRDNNFTNRKHITIYIIIWFTLITFITSCHCVALPGLYIVFPLFYLLWRNILSNMEFFTRNLTWMEIYVWP